MRIGVYLCGFTIVFSITILRNYYHITTHTALLRANSRTFQQMPYVVMIERSIIPSAICIARPGEKRLDATILICLGQSGRDSAT